MASNSIQDKVTNPLPTATYSSRLLQSRASQQSQQLQPPQQQQSQSIQQTLLQQVNLTQSLVNKQLHASQSVPGGNNIATASISINNHNNHSGAPQQQRLNTADARFHRPDMLDSNNLQGNNIVSSFRNNSNGPIGIAAQQQAQQQQQQPLYAINSQNSAVGHGVAVAAASSNNGPGNNLAGNSSNNANSNITQSGPPSTLDLSEFPSLSGSLSTIGTTGNNNINSSNPSTTATNNNVGNNNNNGNTNSNTNQIGGNNVNNNNTTVASSARDSASNQAIGPNNLIAGINNIASGRPYVGIIKDGSSTSVASSTAEFNIHSEEFPALTGSNLTTQGTSDAANTASNNNQLVGSSSIGGLFGPSSSVGAVSAVANAATGPINNINNANVTQLTGNGLSTHSSETNLSNECKVNANQVAMQQASVAAKQNAGVSAQTQMVASSMAHKRGIQTNKDGRVTNIPPGMINDQFGLVGLLTFIRAAESDPNLVNLAFGADLTTLKLDLNSSNNLYSSFPGPWSDIPLKPHEIDFPVPQEYLINNQIRDKLAPIKLTRYGDDTLFFLFYLFPNEMIQAAAANELYLRDWRFHKDEKIWITRAPGLSPVEKASTWERGTYYYFDAMNWRRVAKEFHLEYNRLESRQVSMNHGSNLLPHQNTAPTGNNIG